MSSEFIRVDTFLKTDWESSYLTKAYGATKVSIRVHERVPHGADGVVAMVAREEARLARVVGGFGTGWAALTR